MDVKFFSTHTKEFLDSFKFMCERWKVVMKKFHYSMFVWSKFGCLNIENNNQYQPKRRKQNPWHEFTIFLKLSLSTIIFDRSKEIMEFQSADKRITTILIHCAIDISSRFIKICHHHQTWNITNSQCVVCCVFLWFSSIFIFIVVSVDDIAIAIVY